MAPPFGSTHLRMARAGAIARLARGIRPDAIIERYHNFGGEAIRSAAALNAVAVLEVNAPVIDHAGSSKALLDRALLVQPMRRWRERLCAARRRHRHAQRRRSFRRAFRASGSACSSGAPTPSGSGPARRHRRPYVRPGGHDRRDLRGGVPRRGTARFTWSRRSRSCARAGDKDIGAVFVGDGPELPRVRAAGGRDRHDPLHRRAAPRPHARGARRRRHRRRAVRPRRARAALAGVLLVAAENLRVHGDAACRWSRPRSIGFRRSSQTAAKGCCTICRRRRKPRRGARRHAAEAERRGAAQDARRGGARARGPRLQLGRSLPRARRQPSSARRDGAGAPMKILIPTDAFPPGLRRQRVEHLRAGARPARARPRRSPSCSRGPANAAGVRETDYDGFRVRAVRRRRRPTSRTSATTTRARSSRARSPAISRRCSATNRYDIVHAQHVMTTMAGIEAAHAARRAGGGDGAATTGPCATGRICCTRARGSTLCPACTAAQHGDLHPAARRRAVAARAADDSLHAGEPRGEADRARARRRRDRRQPPHRRGSRGARAGAGAARGSKSFRIRSNVGGASRGRRAIASARAESARSGRHGALRALPRQAGAQQGDELSGRCRSQAPTSTGRW